MVIQDQQSADFERWFQESISNLLGFPAGTDLINYILSFENRRDIRDYLASLLDLSQPKSKKFLEDFFQRWKSPIENSGTKKKTTPDVRPKQTQKPASRDVFKPKQQKQEKDSLSDDDFVQTKPEKKVPFATPEKIEARPSIMSVDASSFLDKNHLSPKDIVQQDIVLKKSGSPFKKRNLRYVPLYTADGRVKTETALLPGRHPCQCLAQKHELINNCFECGRIVCQQEGAGPCMFCGHLVCSVEEQEILARESKKSKKLKEKLLDQVVPEGAIEDEKESASLDKAIAHKNRLLEFDKTSTKRTKVIDDEADYFSSGSRWLSNKQRTALEKRDKEIRDIRHASRLDRKIQLDFIGREVVEREDEDYASQDAAQEAEYIASQMNRQQQNMMGGDNIGLLVDPRIKVTPPKFVESTKDRSKPGKALKSDLKKGLRIQDGELQQIVDKGMCMSMHQPWASLLVGGIKKLEGRSWYSPHRGRLWIAATGKVPDQSLIDDIENQYRHFYPDVELNFPSEYPNACLLGCVNVVDCATNEDYFKQHPNCEEESGSEYLFVCDNPLPLKLMFSIKGQHKIYKLDPEIHKSARKSLQHS